MDSVVYGCTDGSKVRNSRPSEQRTQIDTSDGASSVYHLSGRCFGVGLVIERSLVRLPTGVLSSQLGQLSLPSLRGK